MVGLPNVGCGNEETRTIRPRIDVRVSKFAEATERFAWSDGGCCLRSCEKVKACLWDRVSSGR